MVKNLNKLCFEKLLAVAAVALMCVSMWGCSDEIMHWADGRSLRSVVGFVNDSLVIVSDYHYWTEEVDPFFGTSYDRDGYTHPGLSLYNYRVQLDGAVWFDTLDNSRDDDFNYIRGQLSDSVIWGGDLKSDVSFWKIGEKPYKMKVKKLFDGCSIDVPYTMKLRPWLGGKILVMGNSRNPNIEGFNLDSLGEEYCQYAVLDTMLKTVTYRKLVGDLKWIKKCDDVRAWGDDVYCFMSGERAFEAVLLRNGKDTVDVPIKFTIGDFWGDVLRPNAHLCNLFGDKVVCSGIEWRGGLFFYKEEKVIVDLN